MLLKKLSLINFKNLAQEILPFDEGINCFVGDNGTCKTNIIDSIYYLSMCKSSLPMSDGQCVRHGEQFFVIDGEYRNSAGRREQISCSFTRGAAKTIKRNGKAYERLSDHIGLIPVVIVSPADTALICDAAEERRRYLNGFISQLDREYLATMIRYNSVLAERNKLLKMSADEQMLQIYDAQLVAAGEKIYAKRRETAEALHPVVAEFYALLSGDREQVELTYKSELETMPLADLLLSTRERDRVNGFTTAGIHRDDLSFRIGGLPLRKYGSQGQQKSFIIALKLAQYRIITERFGETPILLLDDVFDKLDEGRVAELLKIVATERFGQIFITDCNRERMKRLLDASGCRHKIFDVNYGKVLQ
ncbi:MAG: DNA replication/repair protein RecF [Alistipes sp.]